MEKENNLFINDGTQLPYELNCSTEQLRNCIFNPNWDNSMDQNDPFESALSSMVSSPATSNAGVPPPSAGGGENFVLRELIGRLGSICNSGEISPQSYIGGNNSTNNSCYSTPLNSPPKLNLSIMDSQIRGNLPIPRTHLPGHQNLAPFPTDPGFVERAARFSCFANKGLDGLNSQIGLNDSELPHRLVPKLDSGKLSKVSSNQSLKISGSQMEVQDNSDEKFSKLSRSSTPENTEVGDSRENSSVSEQITKSQNDGNPRKRKAVQRGKAKEPSSANVASENNENSAKRSKSDEDNVNEKNATKGKAEQNGTDKAAGDGKSSKDNPKPPEPPKDYIHVRARRGQATDAHSLAERVRREKISERMKLLQDLVPGCNKVTGKAVMLDEIINYVQSLQRQVEFLSMKLATINPRMDFNVEALLSKDVIQSRGSLLAHNMCSSDGSTAAAFPYPFQSQTMPMSSIPNGTEMPFSMNHLNAAMGRNPNVQLPPLDNFGESASQVPTFWEDDLQTVVQMGFGQNQTQNFHGIMATSRMKVEL
ncbi:hypothetical protein M9H77_31066 [Catharanthus roseus]|uniref:Uncharacterized protein n=1 Tax=Catharanthus roseus TaxID=4058 RepID=A0ACC0A135_CATRO|nr:hypothetical protein M9H77_31066 [Catharanthus roseus]